MTLVRIWGATVFLHRQASFAIPAIGTSGPLQDVCGCATPPEQVIPKAADNLIQYKLQEVLHG
jgi:hypothetical protein